MTLLGRFGGVDLKMDVNAPVSTWMTSPPRQLAVLLTFDLQNLTRSSVVVVAIPCEFHRDCSRHSQDIVVTRSVWIYERTNAADRQPENITPS